MRNLVIYALFFVLGTQAVLAANVDLVVTNGDTPDPVRLGNNLTYTLVVTNKGPSQAANVVVTDVLPVGIDFVSCSASQGTYTQEFGTVTCRLGTLANGGRATMTIVTAPTLVGVFTNEISVQTDDTDTNTGDNRGSAVTTVSAANRAPELTLSDIVLPVGASTNFTVIATDPDHDVGVSVTNKAKPSGATFANSNFSWTATAAFLNTTNIITFVANDNQGATNSVVTNSMSIVVPFDWNANGVSDGWEWNNFTNLTTSSSGDNDGDGINNYAEYLAGTQPTNANSKFLVTDCATPVAMTNHQVRVSTEAGRKYTILWAEGVFTNGMNWQPFASTNTGVWIEPGPGSTNHIFTDTEGTNTTGHAPVGGVRYYKIKVGMP
jgi:uncharacterized repeat protein (TIGR01451 family)